MKIQQEHLTAIKSFGYTEREARFLYIVAVHSGYFTQAHLRQFSGNRSGRTVRAFIKRALEQEHVKESKHQNNARVYQLTYKPMYAAIGRANIRNRREHSFDFIMPERIASQIRFATSWTSSQCSSTRLTQERLCQL